MKYEQPFNCGDSKYYVVERKGFFIVQRQDQIEKTYIGYARDISQAMDLIRGDAKSSRVRAA